MIAKTVGTLPMNITVFGPQEYQSRLPVWREWLVSKGYHSLSYDPGWLTVLREAFAHTPHCIEASEDGRVCGLLPLTLVSSRLFGRFCVSLPYLNVGGIAAESENVAQTIADRAIKLADEFDVKHLALRHEQPIPHRDFVSPETQKVIMRLPLPSTETELWDSFRPAVRNQVRKGEKNDFAVLWGGKELLGDFYAVFGRNMRDLGTPVFSRRLFESILNHFSSNAELCVLQQNRVPIAGALLLHGRGITEVPSASSLREFNSTNANMLMYWQLLRRAVERGQSVFDFGRSSPDSGTYKFKKQWGALPHDTCWQYYTRRGRIDEVRPESGRFKLAIRLWQKLPIGVANLFGPWIVRGIP